MVEKIDRELSPEQLEAVIGGACCCGPMCPGGGCCCGPMCGGSDERADRDRERQRTIVRPGA